MDQSVIAAIVIISAVLVGMDANTLGAGKHNLGGMADTTPVTWAFGTLLLWIIVLPLYVIMRPKLVAAHKANPDASTAAPGISQRRCAVCDQLYAAEYDACPHCAKANAEISR
ncbi:MAG: hypothetical protein Q7J82_06585 [Coriobacteriia bacterium]|nr:hypothetical protein [Coriobacteriia bacterium]